MKETLKELGNNLVRNCERNGNELVEELGSLLRTEVGISGRETMKELEGTCKKNHGEN